MSKYYEMFKSYDLRGTYPDLNEELYYWVGQGLVKTVLKPEGLSLDINIVRDARYTSPAFYKALYNGIKDAGGNPQNLGIGSTDFMYAACQVTKTPGASVTASHNPKDDNGLKVVKHGSVMLGLAEGLDKVRDYAIERTDVIAIDKTKWVEPIENTDLRDRVVGFFANKMKEIGAIDWVNTELQKQNKKVKIAVDAGNGTGGIVMKILEKLYTNIEFVELYWEPDGNYPNHPADPQHFENLRDLQSVVKNNDDVEFGFAFDGDADRVFFVDDKAEVLQGDFLVAFFAQTLLKKYKENPTPGLEPAIVYLQPGSRCVYETIAESDGIAIPSVQGHTHIKYAMEKFHAIYGGENSGHHYFSQFGQMDSGVLAAVLLIKILTENGKKLSDIFQKLKDTYFISDLISIKLSDTVKFADIKEKLEVAFSDANFSTMDGLSVFYPDWKFCIRPSNTEPVVKMILETQFTDRVKEKLEMVKSAIGIDFKI